MNHLLALASVLLLAVVAAMQAQAAGTPPTIFLPPDAEVVTIVGNKFKLNITQMVQMQSEWKNISDDLEKDEAENGGKPDGEAAEAPADGVDSTNSIESSEPADGAGKAEPTPEPAERDYGFIEDDLHEWLEERATSLADRVARYNDEIARLQGGPKVVSQILLLNTLSDLETLTRENIRSLKWIKYKLQWTNSISEPLGKEVAAHVEQRINENQRIEDRVRGKNNPGNKWLTNVQALRRIMHEQRFSDSIRSSIGDYLQGTFNMMARSRIYEINKPAAILDDGLYYYQAKNRVPAYFPFFSQDSIVNGAFF